MENLLKIDLRQPDIREKTLEHGLSFPVDEELVMMILGSGSRQIPIRTLAMQIVQVINDSNQENLVENLMKINGVGPGKALAIASAIELGRRRSNHLRAPVRTPSDIVPFVRNYAVSNQEHFLVITLNGGREIIQIHVVSVGLMNKTLIHPREIFAVAIKENASAIIICHNHPSGICLPSDEDIEATEILLNASEIMGIALLDHVIVDRETYFSFMEHHLLFSEGE